jgi:glycosyltransferase 2 family protein
VSDPREGSLSPEPADKLHGMRRFVELAYRRGLFFYRYVLPPLVAAAVGWYFYTKLSSPELWANTFQVRVEWLVPSAFLYLLAHAIWGTNSVILLWNQGAHVRWLTGLRAYYISQFGKYVPGKVWVLVLRVGMLGNIGISRTAVGITATYEALTAMAAGAMVGVLLLPTLSAAQSGLNGFSMYWVAPIALVPIGLVGLNRFVNRVNRWRKGHDAPQFPRVKLHLVLFGLLLTSVGWFLMGISLWCALRGLGLDSYPLTWDNYLHLTSINAIAYIIGFLAFFMPAGAGVREFALQTILALELQQVLSPGAAGGLAAVAALVLRLIWTTAELVAAGLLYWLAPTHPPLAIGLEAENANA